MFVLAFWLLLLGSASDHAKMPELSEVNSIDVSAEWDCGWYSWKRSHLIRLTDSVSVCTTTIRVSDVSAVATRTDTIASSTLSSFLRLLGSVELKSMPYDPSFDHTDDYPYQRICLKLLNDSVVIESWSQSRNGKPWQVIIGKDSLVSNSSAIHKSLAVLKPYFHEDVLDSLVKAANSKP